MTAGQLICRYDRANEVHSQVQPQAWGLEGHGTTNK